MNNLIFRALKAEEVDVRPAWENGSKATLLLYQDARCAQTILDDTVGSMNWQREYYEAKGLLFCKIGIRDTDTGEWVWKADTGSKSNIEEDKGLSSDAFKRASVSWGIGRELYTAPTITINLNESDKYNGKLCQSFSVGEMNVSDGCIVKLTVVDKKGNLRFVFNADTKDVAPPVEEKVSCVRTLTDKNEKALAEFCDSMKPKVGREYEGELKRFYEFYMQSSKEKPEETIISKWENLNVQKLWERWIGRKG